MKIKIVQDNGFMVTIDNVNRAIYEGGNIMLTTNTGSKHYNGIYSFTVYEFGSKEEFVFAGDTFNQMDARKQFYE